MYSESSRLKTEYEEHIVKGPELWGELPRGGGEKYEEENLLRQIRVCDNLGGKA